MAYVLITLLYFVTIFFLCKIYQKSFITIGNFVLGLYTFCLISALFVVYETNKYSFSASGYFALTLTMFLLPAISFKQKIIKTIKPVNINLFNLISYTFIFLGILCYLFYVPVIFSLFSLGLSIVALRGEVAGGTAFYNTDSFLFYILALFCQFYPIVIAFYFYSISFLNKSKLFNNLLLFSSTGYIVNVLSSIGRSGFVYWPLMFVFMYILFYNFMLSEIRFKVFQFIKKALIIVFTLFMVITFGRFAVDNFQGSVLSSLFGYFGDQFGNFNSFFDLYVYKDNDLSKFFPIINPSRDKLKPLEEFELMMNLYGVDGNVFSTFIGDLLKEFNKIYIFIFSLFYGLIGMLFLRAKESISFGKVIILIIFCQIPITGIFFYDYSHVVSNLYILFALLLGIIFSKKIVWKKD
jgi:oligosaccharide repeat unit polymerase